MVHIKQFSLLATRGKIIESYQNIPYEHVVAVYASGNNLMNRVCKLRDFKSCSSIQKRKERAMVIPLTIVCTILNGIF